MNVIIKPAFSSYWEFIRQLRNDERVKNNFIKQEHIEEFSHTCFMAEHWKNFWVALDDETPVGYARIIDNDISVCVAPEHQGRGIGTYLINFLTSITDKAGAKVKIGNEASLALFEKCGYKKKYIILER